MVLLVPLKGLNFERKGFGSFENLGRFESWESLKSLRTCKMREMISSSALYRRRD